MFYLSQLFRQKPPKLAHKPKGFTLIEVLVGLVMSSAVIAALLGLVDTLLDMDRQEQVKTRSQQELTAALDYIARDMQEAVYIYDQQGVTETGADGIADDLPEIAGGNPVLVFWKRRFLGKDSEIDHDNNTGTNKVKVGCLETLADGTTCKDQDYYVFSLVVYYLIDNNTNNPNNTWAKNAMRIARWELRGGIANPKTKCPTNFSSCIRQENGKDIYYLAFPDKGFMNFDLNATIDTTSPYSPLAQKMNQWQPHPEYSGSWSGVSPVVLVDYIDSPTASGFKNSISGCSSSEIIPQNAINTTTNPPEITGSFYACVPVASQDPKRPIAQVFIRGNSLLRLKNNPNNAKYSDGQKAYFPTTSIRVQGVGLIGTN